MFMCYFPIYFFARCTLLQKFLVFVLSANPSCGQRIMTLAHSLATKMIDDHIAKESGKLACDFLFKLSSALALNVVGAFNDLGSLKWDQLPLIPTKEEMQHVSKSDYHC